VTPWPVLDDKGRLRFPNRSQAFVLGADADRLAELADLYRPRSSELPAARSGLAAARPLRVGDVFAAALSTGSPSPDEDDLTDLIVGPLVDLSAEARESAKAQYLAAVGAVLSDEEMAMLYRDQLADYEDTDGDAGD